LQLNDYQVAKAKMELWIFYFSKKIQSGIDLLFSNRDDLENDVVAHEASLKAAKTSYFQN
jgi:hypothetical protein